MELTDGMTGAATARQTAIPADTSKRITALRFLLMVFVVFIHNNYTAKGVAEQFAEYGTQIVFNQSAFGRWVQLFISDGIARCAVPLFFLFAAYLQAKKAARYGTLLKKRAKSLLVPYLLWMAIYGFYSARVRLIVLKIAPQFIRNPAATALSWTPLDWVHKLFGYRLQQDGDLGLPELAGQFWFIRDLFILIVLSPLIRFCMKRFPIGFFALVSVPFLLAVPHVFVVRTQALFYYVAGLYWGAYDLPLFEKIDRISWLESTMLFLLTFFVTYCFYGLNTTSYWLMGVAACVLVLKLSAVLVAHEKAFAATRYFAGFSFFLFAIHTPVLNELLRRAWLHFFPMTNGFFCLFEYFGATLLTIALGTGIGIALKKLCPPLFALLTGGR